MLVLARKVGESIMIDHDIRVTVTRIEGNQVKLGIDAPKSVNVYRTELYDRNKTYSASPGG